MKFDDYIGRYRLLENSLQNDERLESLMSRRSFHTFVSRMEERNRFAADIDSVILSEEALRKRIRRKTRLMQKYAARIARACGMIDSPPLREYAVCRYLYGFTHDNIADASFYCVRTVYRHGTLAKKEMEKNLLRIMPTVRRTWRKKYRPSHPLHHKNYALSPEAKKLLRCAGQDSPRMEKLGRMKSEKARVEA